MHCKIQADGDKPPIAIKLLCTASTGGLGIKQMGIWMEGESLNSTDFHQKAQPLKVREFFIHYKFCMHEFHGKF